MPAPRTEFNLAIFAIFATLKADLKEPEERVTLAGACGLGRSRGRGCSRGLRTVLITARLTITVVFDAGIDTAPMLVKRTIFESSERSPRIATAGAFWRGGRVASDRGGGLE